MAVATDRLQRESVSHALDIPPLENGDRLTREEFERRYEVTPNLRGAELIEGTVYMPSPIHTQQHALPHAQASSVLSIYALGTPGVLFLTTPTVRIDQNNELEPDLVLMVEPSRGGAARIEPDDYLSGPPELVIEIAASSTSRDLHQKFSVYRRAGVQEYAVWQVRDRKFDWWQRVDGSYVLIEADAEGVRQSVVFPGLWLAVPQLLAGDMPAVVATLQRGLQSEDHAAFVTKLNAQGGSA